MITSGGAILCWHTCCLLYTSKTGLRISEFCGLPISDLDFKEHTINIDHQLQKKSKIGYYIQETKTTSGTRKIPMTADVEECFQKIIEKRNPPKAEPLSLIHI